MSADFFSQLYIDGTTANNNNNSKGTKRVHLSHTIKDANGTLCCPALLEYSLRKHGTGNLLLSFQQVAHTSIHSRCITFCNILYNFIIV